MFLCVNYDLCIDQSMTVTYFTQCEDETSYCCMEEKRRAIMTGSTLAGNAVNLLVVLMLAVGLLIIEVALKAGL